MTDWFDSGEVVAIASYDEAQDFLEGDEWDYEWRLCDVPQAALLPLVGDDYNDFFAEALKLDRDYAETVERCSSIIRWMASEGGAVKALTKQPPMLFLTSDGLKFIDGWHRVGITLHLPTMGKIVRSVPCLIAREP